MPQLILYNYFRSSTSYRVRIALELKSLQYKYMPIHLLNNGGEQNSESYHELNPLGEVPTLVDGDFVLSQSLPIIEYLEEKFPTPSLFPVDAKDKATARQICENINCGIHPLQNLKVLGYLQSELKMTEIQKQNWLKHWIEKGLWAVEALVAPRSNKFALSNVVSVADIFIAAQMVSAERFKIDIKQFKSIYKVYENCMNLEAFQKAHPKNQIDSPKELL